MQRLAVIGTQGRGGSGGRMRRTGVRRRYAADSAYSAVGVAAVGVHVEMGGREHLRHVVDVERIGFRMRRRKVVGLRRLRTAGADEGHVRMQNGGGRRRGGGAALAYAGSGAAGIRTQVVEVFEVARIRTGRNVVAMEFLVGRVDDGGGSHRKRGRRSRMRRWRRRWRWW